MHAEVKTKTMTFVDYREQNTLNGNAFHSWIIRIYNTVYNGNWKISFLYNGCYIDLLVTKNSQTWTERRTEATAAKSSK